MKIEIVELSKLKPNENNPRKISKARLEELKKSLQAFPDMLKLRPLIVDENNVVIGGNQRFKALIALGIKSAPVIYARGLTPDRRKEFIVRDNAHYGEWDFDFNLEEWNFDSVRDWGADVSFPEAIGEEHVFKNLKIVIDFKSDTEAYSFVLGTLLKQSKNLSEAVKILIKKANIKKANIKK